MCVYVCVVCVCGGGGGGGVCVCVCVGGGGGGGGGGVEGGGFNVWALWALRLSIPKHPYMCRFPWSNCEAIVAHDPLNVGPCSSRRVTHLPTLG